MDLENTLITGSDADALFGGGSRALGSRTLEATLRFIALKHHQGDIETIKQINFERNRFCDGYSERYYIEIAKGCNFELLIISEANGAQLPIVNEDGWMSLDAPPYPVAPFLSKISETRVYVNEGLKKSIIFVRNATEKWIDLLCSSLFRVLPWYFSDGISEDEMALFKSINDNDSDCFTSIVNKLCGQYDFQSARFKHILLGWSDGCRKKQIELLENSCYKYDLDLDTHQAQVAKLLVNLENTNTRLMALKAQGDSADDALYKFFLAHKQIFIYKAEACADGNFMDYCIADTIEYYDADAFMRLYNNPSSPIGGAREDVKEVLLGVFNQNKGVFRAEAMFRMTNLASIAVQQSYTSGQLKKTHLPHPHLVDFGCLGGNENYVTNHLRKGDWDLAIEQTIAAVKNINFGDAAVIARFVLRVQGAMNSCKCIIADNGKEMTPAEFLKYLKENKGDGGIENG